MLPLMLVEMELATVDADEGPTVLVTVYVTDLLASPALNVTLDVERTEPAVLQV